MHRKRDRRSLNRWLLMALEYAQRASPLLIRHVPLRRIIHVGFAYVARFPVFSVSKVSFNKHFRQISGSMWRGIRQFDGVFVRGGCRPWDRVQNSGVIEVASLVPFGVKPRTAGLKARCVPEREMFAMCILVEMAEDLELVDARCAVASYPAGVARRAGVRGDFDEVVRPLVAAGYLTFDPVSAVGPTGPGLIFRVRRPDVVLTVESAGPLWTADSWARKRTA